MSSNIAHTHFYANGPTDDAVWSLGINGKVYVSNEERTIEAVVDTATMLRMLSSMVELSREQAELIARRPL